MLNVKVGVDRHLTGHRFVCMSDMDVPGGAAIVAFHGKPKPPDAAGWAKDMWRGLQDKADQTLGSE